MGPFDEQLIRLLRSIPRGRVVTHRELGRMLDPRLRESEIAMLMQGICGTTIRHLIERSAEDPAGDVPDLPCWRVVDEEVFHNGGMSAPVGGKDSPIYRLIIRPLIEDGIPLTPPLYRIPETCAFHWTEQDEPTLGSTSIDEATRKARVAYFQQREVSEAKRTFTECCQYLTHTGPYPLGFGETPTALIYSVRLADDEVVVDLFSKSLWNDIRVLHCPRVAQDEDQDEDDALRTPLQELHGYIFGIEEWLDDGRWRLWHERPDGEWDVPDLDSELSALADAPVNDLLDWADQFRKILDLMAWRIVFYVDEGQWKASSAPETAYDPPKVLQHAGLVRQAPFFIREVALDEQEGAWRLTMESVHFPENQRTVVALCAQASDENPMNAAGQLWWELSERCSAWFDLRYSPNIPDEQRQAMYAAYGGWHAKPDGSWVIDVGTR